MTVLPSGVTLTGPLGFRTLEYWRGHYQSPIYRHYVWHPSLLVPTDKWFHATCSVCPTNPPGEIHECGFHVHWNPVDNMSYIAQVLPHRIVDQDALFTMILVEAAGAIVMYSGGLRSGRLRIIAVVDVPRPGFFHTNYNDPTVVAQDFGVPVMSLADVTALAASHNVTAGYGVPAG